MSELKTVVVLNSEIINVGEWDYREKQIVINQTEIDAANQRNASVVNEEGYIKIPEPIVEVKEENPLPIGATIEEREMFFTEKHGWREVGWTPPLTADEKLAQLEQEKEQLAQTLDMVLTDLIPTLLTGE